MALLRPKEGQKGDFDPTLCCRNRNTSLLSLLFDVPHIRVHPRTPRSNQTSSSPWTPCL